MLGVLRTAAALTGGRGLETHLYCIRLSFFVRGRVVIKKGDEPHGKSPFTTLQSAKVKGSNAPLDSDTEIVLSNL
jgi:hypothetical protein